MKAGWKSTEFLLTALSAVTGLLLVSGVVGDGSMWHQALGGALSMLSAAGYSIGRSIVKSAEEKSRATNKYIETQARVSDALLNRAAGADPLESAIQPMQPTGSEISGSN